MAQNRGSPAGRSLRWQTSIAKIERLQAAGHRPTLLARTVGGERPQIDTINSDDGNQAASLPDPQSASTLSSPTAAVTRRRQADVRDTAVHQRNGTAVRRRKLTHCRTQKLTHQDLVHGALLAGVRMQRLQPVSRGPAARCLRTTLGFSTRAHERDSASRARVRAAAEPWQTGRRATHSQLVRLGAGRLAPRRKTVAPAAAALPSARVVQTNCPGRHGSRTRPAGRAGPTFPHLRR
jgi:hypothetical protein